MKERSALVLWNDMDDHAEGLQWPSLCVCKVMKCTRLSTDFSTMQILLTPTGGMPLAASTIGDKLLGRWFKSWPGVKCFSPRVPRSLGSFTPAHYNGILYSVFFFVILWWWRISLSHYIPTYKTSLTLRRIRGNMHDANCLLYQFMVCVCVCVCGRECLCARMNVRFHNWREWPSRGIQIKHAK